MNKTILVIGSVNAKQYKAVRLEALRAGWKPQIVRMSLGELYFHGDWSELVRLYATAEEATVCDDDTDDVSLLVELAHRHLAARCGEIYAVVMDQIIWDVRWEHVDVDVVGTALKQLEDVGRWVVSSQESAEYTGVFA